MIKELRARYPDIAILTQKGAKRLTALVKRHGLDSSIPLRYVSRVESALGREQARLAVSPVDYNVLVNEFYFKVAEFSQSRIQNLMEAYR